MELLWDRTFRPRGPRELGDLLEGQAIGPRRVAQHQPILATGVGRSGCGRLVTGPVAQAEELPVELRQRTGVGGVQDHLQKSRIFLTDVHAGSFRQPLPGRSVKGDGKGSIATSSDAPRIKLATTSERRAPTPFRRMRESASASPDARRQ